MEDITFIHSPSAPLGTYFLLATYSEAEIAYTVYGAVDTIAGTIETDMSALSACCHAALFVSYQTPVGWLDQMKERDFQGEPLLRSHVHDLCSMDLICGGCERIYHGNGLLPVEGDEFAVESYDDLIDYLTAERPYGAFGGSMWTYSWPTLTREGATFAEDLSAYLNAYFQGLRDRKETPEERTTLSLRWAAAAEAHLKDAALTEEATQAR